MAQSRGDSSVSTITVVVGIVVLVLMLTGDPDLLDAVISWVGRQR